MNPYPYGESKWMTDYMDFGTAQSTEEMLEELKKKLNDPAHLNLVIREQDEKIDRLEDTIYKLRAPLMLKIKWKLATLINKLPKIRIEW
tara:strand:+ start:586 stop:852 length:267 start_codon:yes stop_codon:yes gene_type:complete